MIAKLVAWGDDRADGDRAHVARAARVPGARHPDDDPVLPVADASSPEYREGRYDTTYLDRLLDGARAGESFTELDAADRRADGDRGGDSTRISGASAAADGASGAASARDGSAPWLEQAARQRGAARMTFEIEIDGRSRSVVDRARGPAHASG